MYKCKLMSIVNYSIEDEKLLLSQRTTAFPLYPGMHSQIMVLTGDVSSTLQAALTPQGSIFTQGLMHSPLKQAVCDGHSLSALHFSVTNQKYRKKKIITYN